MTKPAPGRVVRIKSEMGATIHLWPVWDHPLGGPGRWAVVIRHLRRGIEAAPLIEGYTLAPQSLEYEVETIEEYRARVMVRHVQRIRDRQMAESSGCYSAAQLASLPAVEMPAWLGRGMPTTPAVPRR